jgi:hypothetical protein
LVESRKSLKTAYQSAQVEQAYQAFCASSQGVLYLKRILIQLPLAYWLELFGTWDHLFHCIHSKKIHFGMRLLCVVIESNDMI